MKVRRAVLIHLVVAAFLLIPIPAGASHQTLVVPECTADLPSTCSTTFQLNSDATVGVHHAHFHELLVDADMTLDWFDSSNKHIFRWTCTSTTAADQNATVVPFCDSEQLSSQFSGGTQTLKVSAETYLPLTVCSDSCTFHASLRFTE